VGVNQWDEEWELGVVNNTIATNRIRSKNLIQVRPSAKYFFYCGGLGSYFDVAEYDANRKFLRKYGIYYGREQVLSNDAHFLEIGLHDVYGTTYKGDICINLSDASINGKYFPYIKRQEDLAVIRKYFPQGMKSAGTAHDEIRYNKAAQKWEYSEGRIRSKALSELNWVIGSTGVFMAVVDDMVAILNTTTGIIGKYILSIGTGVKLLNNEIDKGYCTNGGAVGGVGKVAIRDNAYTNVDAFKQHLEETNAILYYESNNWEWVELDAEDQNFRDYYKVADFGTEQSQSSVPSVPSANFSADIIYQFNAVDMIREHELEITELQQVIATMQAQLTALTNGGQ
jgi:hypothetical protein